MYGYEFKVTFMSLITGSKKQHVFTFSSPRRQQKQLHPKLLFEQSKHLASPGSSCDRNCSMFAAMQGTNNKQTRHTRSSLQIEAGRDNRSGSNYLLPRIEPQRGPFVRQRMARKAHGPGQVHAAPHFVLPADSPTTPAAWLLAWQKQAALPPCHLATCMHRSGARALAQRLTPSMRMRM